MVRLVVNADDLGWSRWRDDGILRSIEEGVVRRVSLMVNGKTTVEAVERLRVLIQKMESFDPPSSSFSSSLDPSSSLSSCSPKHPQRTRPRVTVGLHLNLTEGRPLTSGGSLLDPSSLSPSSSLPSSGPLPRSLPSDHESGQGGRMRGKMGMRKALEEGEVRVEDVLSETRAQILSFLSLCHCLPHSSLWVPKRTRRADQEGDLKEDLHDHQDQDRDQQRREGIHMDGHQHIMCHPLLVGPLSSLCSSMGVASVRVADEEWISPSSSPSSSDPSSSASIFEFPTAFLSRVSEEGREARREYEMKGIECGTLFVGLRLMGSRLSLPSLSSHLLLALSFLSTDHRPTRGDPERVSENEDEDEDEENENENENDEDEDEDEENENENENENDGDGDEDERVVEWMVHPGEVAPNTFGDEFDQSPDRSHELSILTSPSLFSLLSSLPFVLSSY